MSHDIALIFVCTYQTPSTPSTTPAKPSPKPTATGWCVPKAGVPDAQLQANLDYACGQGVDCSPIQPGGACFEPNTVLSHAAYAMNLYYQTTQKNPWNCDFSQTATLTSQNPSKLSSGSICIYVLQFLSMTHTYTSKLLNRKRSHIVVRMHAYWDIVVWSVARDFCPLKWT